MEKQKKRGRKPGRTHTEEITIRAEPGFAAMIKAALRPGETMSGYLRAAAEKEARERQDNRFGPERLDWPVLTLKHRSVGMSQFAGLPSLTTPFLSR